MGDGARERCDDASIAATSWRVGDVRITAIIERVLSLPAGGAESLVPGATAPELASMEWLRRDYLTGDGLLRFAIQSFLIEEPHRALLIDTCVGNHKPRRNPLFADLDTPFLDRLASSGRTRESIDIVVCTHLHVDHVGWNTILDDGEWRPTFPGAVVLVSADELAHFHTCPPGDPLWHDSIEPLARAGLLRTLSPDGRVTERVRVVPTPGHTPGHVSVVVESGGQTAWITGDVLHHPCQLARPDWASDCDLDPARATASRASVLSSVASSGALLLGTHFAPPAGGRLIEHGLGYRLEPELGPSRVAGASEEP